MTSEIAKQIEKISSSEPTGERSAQVILGESAPEISCYGSDRRGRRHEISNPSVAGLRFNSATIRRIIDYDSGVRTGALPARTDVPAKFGIQP